MMYKFKSIRKKFLAIGILFTLVISMVYIFSSSFMTSEIIIDMINEDSSKHLETHVKMIDNWLKERINEIEIYANNPIVKSMDKDEIYKFLKQERNKHSEKYLSFLHSDLLGNYSTDLYKDVGNIGDREYFRQVKQGNTILSNPVISKSTGENIVVIAAPIWKENDEISGVFAGTIDLNEFYYFVEQFRMDERYDNTYIISKSGEIISHINKDYIMKENINIPSELIGQDLADKSSEILNNKKGNFILSNNQAEIMIAFHEIPNTEGWRIITQIPMDLLFEPMKKVVLILITIGIISILIGILFSSIFARTQAQPIIELKEVFDKAADGNLTVRANTKYLDEVGKAGKSFNIMMDKINDLTFYDHLTNLPNKQTFRNILTRQLNNEAEIKSLGILVISIDKFSEINDRYGYKMGDFVLKDLAYRLKRELGKNDIVSRFNGDEFIVLINGENNRSIINKAKKLFNISSETLIKEGEKIHISVSAGLTFYAQDFKDGDRLIKSAGIAKSTVVNAGGNNLKLFNSYMIDDLKKHMDMTGLLRDALENKEFLLVYQPILSIENNNIIGAEALLRWNSSKGLMSPDVFIPKLEETKLILPVGEWVIDEVCRQIKQWIRKGYRAIPISINVSTLQFHKYDFVKIVKNALNKYNLEGRFIELEITEDIAMENIDRQKKKLDDLKKIGVKISIDDFGTGYSSLKYLKNLPIDTLKIDKSFIRDIMDNEKNKAIISTIINMGQNLGVSTTAEGVETKEQFDFIKKLGCEKAQGYLFSKPLYATEFEEYIKNDKLIIEKGKEV